MLKRIMLLAGFFIAHQAAFADDSAKLVGVWKLVSFETEVQDGGERRADFGKRPKGYVIFTAQGRMMGVIEAEGRSVPKTGEERAKAFESTVAYSGTYRLEGNTWTTSVDVAWNPGLSGKDSVRVVKFDGDRLDVISAWAPNPALGGTISRNLLSWERVK
jgi:Lipocalin-like domain